MKEIENFVDHLECPSLNGIVYPDGKIQLINLLVNWGSPTSYKLLLGNQTSISALEEQGNLSWSGCTILHSTENVTLGIKAICGEGDYGSDGFLAVFDLTLGQLKWLAFFNSSNPFDKIKIEKKYISAFSTAQCQWNFKLDDPVSIDVQCS